MSAAYSTTSHLEPLCALPVQAEGGMLSNAYCRLERLQQSVLSHACSMHGSHHEPSIVPMLEQLQRRCRSKPLPGSPPFNARRQSLKHFVRQARQLLLDPAVVREFERLRGVAEAKAQEVRKLQEELQAVNFSQESKAGRLLMAKCRALQARPPSLLCLPGKARSLPFDILEECWHALQATGKQVTPPGVGLAQAAVLTCQE